MINGLLNTVYTVVNFAAPSAVDFKVVVCNPNTANKGNVFFGFPHWWKYINTGEVDFFGKCKPVVKIPNDIWAIALAGVDMLLYLAGLASVAFIVIAGVTYMLSEGNPEKAAAARKRIANAGIGLIVSLTAIVLVRFIGNSIG